MTPINNNLNKESNTKTNVLGIIKMSDIDFKDWEKLDLRVGKIEKT